MAKKKRTTTSTPANLETTPEDAVMVQALQHFWQILQQDSMGAESEGSFTQAEVDRGIAYLEGSCE